MLKKGCSYKQCQQVYNYQNTDVHRNKRSRESGTQGEDIHQRVPATYRVHDIHTVRHRGRGKDHKGRKKELATA